MKYSDKAAPADRGWSRQAWERSVPACEGGDFSCEGFKMRAEAVLLMSRDGKSETLCRKNVTGLLIESQDTENVVS